MPLRKLREQRLSALGHTPRSVLDPSAPEPSPFSPEHSLCSRTLSHSPPHLASTCTSLSAKEQPPAVPLEGSSQIPTDRHAGNHCRRVDQGVWWVWGPGRVTRLWLEISPQSHNGHGHRELASASSRTQERGMNVLARANEAGGRRRSPGLQASRRDQDRGAAELRPRHKLQNWLMPRPKKQQGIMLPHRLSWSPRAFPTAWTQPPHSPLSSSSQGLFCSAGH